MIKLECPGCGKKLEIDEGFAGGICRCYDCGTLMTVPADAGGAAERLERAGRRSRPNAPGEQPVPDAEEADTFVTSTGRTIEVTRDQLSHVVVAKKAHMGVRAAVIGAFIVFVLALIVALVVLGGNMLREADKEQQARHVPADQPAATGPQVIGSEVASEVFTYDPDANPYFISEPNLFGMPIETDADQTLVIVADTSGAMSKHIDFMKEVLALDLRAIGATTRVVACFADDAGERHFPATATPPADWDMDGFAGLLERVRAEGGQRRTGAMTFAVAQHPARIVLIHSLMPVRFEMDKVRALLSDRSIPVDVIQVGYTNEAMRDFAEQSGGRYVHLPDGQIEEWYLEYLARQ